MRKRIVGIVLVTLVVVSVVAVVVPRTPRPEWYERDWTGTYSASYTVAIDGDVFEWMNVTVEVTGNVSVVYADVSLAPGNHWIYLMDTHVTLWFDEYSSAKYSGIPFHGDDGNEQHLWTFNHDSGLLERYEINGVYGHFLMQRVTTSGTFSFNGSMPVNP